MIEHQPLIGKTIGITGATAGIGLAAARVLAAKGATILGMGRSAERAAQAAADIRLTVPGAQVHFFTADLSALRQVRRLAEEIGEYVTTRHDGKLDVLVNNAGTITSRYTDTEDGYETVFTVNHLAPFLLTRELLPLLQAAPAARILTVSSRSHRNMRILWGNVMLRRFYNPLLAYKQSKLANVLFTAEFNRRLADTTHIRAYAIDPGLVNTEIGSKNNHGILRWAWDLRRRQGADPSVPARTIAMVARRPKLDPPDGIYWRDCRSIAPSRYALRADEAAKLWALSEQLCAPEDRFSG
ncbi:MAG: SDR family NAD(P)-dependent oxidoreductase [Bellilinea sp.]